MEQMMVPQGLRPANERRRYKVTPSLIGWAANLESALAPGPQVDVSYLRIVEC